MPRPILTYELANAAALDAGNRSMRKAERSIWNIDDWNVMAREFNRLWPTDPGLRASIAEHDNRVARCLAPDNQTRRSHGPLSAPEPKS